MRSRASLATALLLVAATARAGDAPGSSRRAQPADFGKVVMNDFSTKAKMPPVVFQHWLHRAKYTCRLCHVDIGFAMTAGETNVRAADNAKGIFCGACHNDRVKTDDGRTIFAACTLPLQPGRAGCGRCHSGGSQGELAYDFSSFTKTFPRGRFGNGIDWELAESSQRIRPIDYVEGVSFRRASLKAQKNFALSAKLEGMPDIIFSHAKHTVWSGCEGCHPQIFVGVKKGTTKFTMVDIFQGKSCGVCHVNVAFPMIDCQRCHSKPVQ
jgi:c(7)-type cytochrome triheme protein